MRRRQAIAVTALALGSLVTAGCNDARASGGDDGQSAATAATTASRSYPLADYTGIELSGPDRVVVRQGAAFSVTARGPQAALDRLVLRVDEDTLVITRRSSIDMNWRSTTPVATITVTMPAIGHATLDGSGALSIDRMAGEANAVSLSGSGTIDVRGIASDRLTVALAGSGDIVLAGRATRTDVEVAGSGAIKAAGLTAQSAKVDVAGSGNTALLVSGDAEISIAGSGDVAITGGARCAISTAGSGKATCR